MLSILKKLKISEIEISEIIDDKWHFWNENSYFSRINNLMRDALTKKQKDWGTFDKKYRKKTDNLKRKTPALIEEILQDCKTTFFPEYDYSYIEILIDDFKYYVKNKEHKDFNRWLKLCGSKEK